MPYLFSYKREDTMLIQLSDRGYHIYLAIRQWILCLFGSHTEDNPQMQSVTCEKNFGAWPTLL